MGSAMGHVSLRVAIKIEQETGFSYSVLLNKSKPASTNPSNYFLFHSVPFCSEFYTFLHKPWHLQAQAGHLWWGISQLLLLVHQLADEFDLCKGRKALTSCQKQLYPVAICDDISVTLGGWLLPTQISTSPTGQVSHLWQDLPSTGGKIPPWLASSYFNAKGHNYVLVTWFAREWALEPNIRSELVLRLAHDLASLDGLWDVGLS